MYLKNWIVAAALGIYGVIPSVHAFNAVECPSGFSTSDLTLDDQRRPCPSALGSSRRSTVSPIIFVKEIRSRGFMKGLLNGRERINAGQTLVIPFEVMGKELMAISATLSDNSGGADIDLSVIDMDENVIVDDGGPGTGVPGSKAQIKWRPDDCGSYQLVIRNVGSQQGYVKLRANETRLFRCE